MSGFYQLGWADVPVRFGPRGSILNRRNIRVVGDDPRYQPPLVALALNPEMIDWLLCYLPYQDGFTQQLKGLRDEMRDELWEATVA